MEHLDGYSTIVPLIVRTTHNGHSPTANFAVDAILAGDHRRKGSAAA
jgi:hypothetical protein